MKLSVMDHTEEKTADLRLSKVMKKLQQGRWEEAATVLQHLLELEPKNPDLHPRVGVCLWQKGYVRDKGLVPISVSSEHL